MSDTSNPFEQTMSMSSGESDPFVGALPEPFGITPSAQEAKTMLNLGSQQTALNPFEIPDEDSSGGHEPTPPTNPIINLGNQPNAATPFTEPKNPDIPVKEISSSRLNLLDAKPGVGKTDAEAKPEAIPRGKPETILCFV